MKDDSAGAIRKGLRQKRMQEAMIASEAKDDVCRDSDVEANASLASGPLPAYATVADIMSEVESTA